MLTPVQEAALSIIAEIVDREPRYDAANRVLSDLGNDFTPRIAFMDGRVWVSMMKMIDAALGDPVGSYYLEECRTMRYGGIITDDDGSIWPIRSVSDVRAYLEHLSEKETA